MIPHAGPRSRIRLMIGYASEDHADQKVIITSNFSETNRVKEVHALVARPHVTKLYSIGAIRIAIRDPMENRPNLWSMPEKRSF